RERYTTSAHAHLLSLIRATTLDTVRSLFPHVGLIAARALSYQQRAWRASHRAQVVVGLDASVEVFFTPFRVEEASDVLA
ncbi:MAG: hypothetical protein ACXVCX_11525, partial [Ktedonobacterales bacterium]